MAHSLGSTVLARSSAATSPITRSATTAAGDTVLVLFLDVKSATDRAGGAPTFNGVAGLQANSTQKAASSPEAGVEVWYWAGNIQPGNSGALFIGTANIVIPNTGSLTIFSAAYTGRAASGFTSQFDAANGGNNTSTNPTTGAIVSTVNGAIYFAATAGGWQTFAPSARAGTSLYETDDGATGGGGQYLLQGAAGSQAMTWTFGTSNDWGAVGVAFKEVPAPSPAAGGLSLAGTVTTLALGMFLGAGSLAFAGHAPTLSIGNPNNTTISIPAGSLRFQGPARAPVIIPIAAGALGLTGQAPAIAHTIPIANGSLGFSGQTPVIAHTTPIGAGTLAFAGHAPSLAHTIPIAAGTLTLAGTIAGSGQFVEPAAAAIAFTGHAPTITSGRTIAIPAGALLFKGPARSSATTIPIDAGALGLSGHAPALHATLFPAVGALTLAGYAPALAHTLPMSVGTLSLAGQAPSLAITLPVASGTLAFAGLAPTVSVAGGGGTSIAIPVGSLSLAGQAPAVLNSKVIAIPVGTLSLSGQFLGQVFGGMTPAALTLTGHAPTVQISGQTTITIGAGPLSLVGHAPSLAFTFPVAAGSLTFTGYTPSVNGAAGIPIAAGTLTLAGLAPAALVHHATPIAAGSLAFTGQSVALDRGIAIGAGALALTGYAPTLAAGQLPITASPHAGSLAFTGHAPAIVTIEAVPDVIVRTKAVVSVIRTKALPRTVRT